MAHLEMIQMCLGIRTVQLLWVRGRCVEAPVPSLGAKGKADLASHYPLHSALPLMRRFPSNDNNNGYHQLSSRVPRTVSRSFPACFPLMLTTTPGGSYHDYPHFTKEEIKAQKG